MLKEKKWKILFNESRVTNHELRIGDIVKILLGNRGLKTKKEIDAFLHADITSVTSQSVGIDKKQLTKALKRIEKAVQEKEHIVVFGDYDVDGIAGTAILWETLYSLGARVTPYIPNRMEEGYGLSSKGISNVKSQISNVKLILTVDNGIVANEAVDFANKNNIDVIITDHHTIGKKLPNAHAIVHTTAVCGAAVAYLLADEISNVKSNVIARSETTKQSLLAKVEPLIHSLTPGVGGKSAENSSHRVWSKNNDHLALVALATVADLVPLTGANRILLRFGLAELRNTRRPGLLALFNEAKIEPENIGVYEIGHIIAPRLNAMGRLESAMDSLRLLCTKDRLRAKVLADTLNRINKERQLLTQSAAEHAIKRVTNDESRITKKLLFIAHEEYEEGIIGLVAGKLVEEFYLPAIVLSKGKLTSKASARSIAGFNIIAFIRTSSHLLINAGGHPMAAGFTIETKNITALQEILEKLAETQIDDEILQRILKIDMKIPLEIITQEFYQKLQELSPFGMGNPEPTFVSTVFIQEIKTVGTGKHVKLKVSPIVIASEAKYQTVPGEAKQSRQTVIPAKAGIQENSGSPIGSGMTMDAIAFGFGDKANTLKSGDQIDIVYTIAENEWQGKTSLQVKIKDIQ